MSELQETVMDREAWRAAIHRLTKSRTRLSNWTELASHGRKNCLCSEDNTVYISRLNHLLQLQIFTVIIFPFWFPELSFLLTLFKIFSHASPLKILSSLSTTLLTIPAFFSSVKLINNEGEQVKEKGQRGRKEGLFNKLKFKVYWELLPGLTFYWALYVHYYI